MNPGNTETRLSSANGRSLSDGCLTSYSNQPGPSCPRKYFEDIRSGTLGISLSHSSPQKVALQSTRFPTLTPPPWGSPRGAVGGAAQGTHKQCCVLRSAREKPAHVGEERGAYTRTSQAALLQASAQTAESVPSCPVWLLRSQHSHHGRGLLPLASLDHT